MHIYFSGISGKGLSALAHIALDAGFEVSGSDLAKTVSSEELANRGANLSYRQDGEFLQQVNEASRIDMLIYTAALPEDHPELSTAEELNIYTAKRHEFISSFASNKNLKLLAISGTHGKTTTTAMVVWLFKQFNLPVCYAIGADIQFGNGGAYQEKAEWFVFEADEFDRNMLRYEPSESVIVNIDYDHKDTYPSRQDYEAAFEKFIKKSHHATLWQNDAKKISVNPRKHTIIPMDRNFSPITVGGEHNRSNAWLAATGFLFATQPQHKDDQQVFTNVLQKLNSFPSTKRRMERIAKNIYSDFAHTPEEIKATLQAASEQFESIIVVYQPHQNIRQHELLGKYEDCFAVANRVYWTPTYLSREKPELDVLSPEQLIPATDRGKFEPSELNANLFSTLQYAAESHAIIFMGAGDIDDWVRANLA